MSYTLSIRRFLNIGTATCPTFSPSGDEVAFLANITGVPQVWKVGREGGWPGRLTFYDERIGDVSYSPVDDLLAFTRDAGGNERMQIFTVTGDGHEVTRHTNDDEAIHNLGPWSRDGSFIAYSSNARDPRYFDVHLLEVDCGCTHPVCAEEGSNVPLAWLDSRSLVVQKVVTNLDYQLTLVNIETGEQDVISPGPAHYSSACVANGQIYVVTDHGRNHRGLARLCHRSGTLEYVWAEERDLDFARMDEGSGRLVLGINRDGFTDLQIGTLEGDFQPVAGLPRGVMSFPVLSPDGNDLAVALVTPTRPSNIWVVGTAGPEPRVITSSSRAGIPAARMTEPVLVRYGSFDGLEIPALLFMPAESAPPHPVVIDIHGGPESQRRPDLNPVTQYLAHRGFAVLAPNVRGSAGYGREYLRLDDVEKRMDAVRDIEYAHRWLEDHPDLDAGRTALMGGSYGGFMVLACMTTYPDLWAAGIDIVGIANFETFLENTGPWRRRLREAEYGSLERDREFLRSISPIHKAGEIRAPLLVIHGANDPRVPIGEAEQIVNTVRDQGGTVDYLTFPDEGHGVIKLPNRVAAYTRIAEFLDRHLR